MISSRRKAGPAPASSPPAGIGDVEQTLLTGLQSMAVTARSVVVLLQGAGGVAHGPNHPAVPVRCLGVSDVSRCAALMTGGVRASAGAAC
ncbi:MAG: hypothetical protein OXS29_13625 [bacterium]|nr:hypothetical protein [bacterium]MDE0289566.1 hypothetical protein [bacterium]MDE0437722.1 hypothetical protein [bacterium]